MFTGIITHIGVVEHAPGPDDQRLWLRWTEGPPKDLRLGESVAVDGVCLTVTRLFPEGTGFDVSPETMKVAAPFRQGARVNLERALALGDRLGGHWVMGHVDGSGAVEDTQREGEFLRLTVRVKPGLLPYLPKKASVALSGVSLTVNETEEDKVSFMLVPHTLAATNLGDLMPGASVNVEVDMVARYLEKLLTDRGTR